MEWNSTEWIRRWQTTIAEKRFQTRPLLKEVYMDTLKKVQSKGYNLNGKWVDLNLNPDIESQTVFYNGPINTIQTGKRDKRTEISVMCMDCLELARNIVFSRPDLNVCVLNLANYNTPGGGVYGGSNAQEEYLFRCSDYFRSLYQFGRFNVEYGVKPHPYHRYPLHRRFGAVFSKGVTVFRDKQDNGYALLNNPFKVNMIAIAAHMNPPITKGPNGEARFTPAEAEYMTHKVRTILRIAYENGQTALVLGALGCGAFNNPPKHVAEIFRTVINEPEFAGLFDYIYFAIINDHNSHRNYEAFKSTFEETYEVDDTSDKSKIIKLLNSTNRKGIDKVLVELEKIGFYDAPGSVEHHSAYRGGLAEHSIKVYEAAMKLKEGNPSEYGGIGADSIIITSLLHDICKADVYFIKSDGKPGVSFKKFPIGHGEKSVIMLLRIGLELSEEEMLAIRWHMGIHTIKEKSVDESNFEEALRSKAGKLINLIRSADGAAAHPLGEVLKGKIKVPLK